MTKFRFALASVVLIVALASLALVVGVGTADARAKHYHSCKQLNGRYIAGVAKSRRAARHAPAPSLVYVNAALYKANKGLDRDHDGVACELPPGVVIGVS